jgi:ABC-type transport system involved in cytochrome c biogenesis permease subunit
MATADILNERFGSDSNVAVGPAVEKLLRPLASLRLTVALLAMAVVLVFAGTLAQVDKDIWQVVDEYFRCQIAWIDLQVFLPPAFFPNFMFDHQPNVPDWMVIPFPGGRLIGTLMFLNLVAAHGIRFKAQAKGNQLWAGLGVIGLGMLTTWLVVVSGSSADGLQSKSWVEWTTLWTWFKVGLTMLWAAAVYEVTRMGTRESTAARVRTPGLFLASAIGTTAFGIGLAWLWIWGNALDDSSMRILWQLVKATFAAVVMLIGCMMVFKKRAGIVLLHGGIGLMMFSELLVGLTAVEAQISLEEGQTSNFASDHRSCELAIVETSGTDSETHVVVPGSRLKSSVGHGKISNELLPFDIEVLKYYGNAVVRPPMGEHKIEATHGIGATQALVPVGGSTGVDTDTKVDMPGAIVRLTKRGSGEEIGTYLAAVLLSMQDRSETIEVDGKKYDLALRFRRDYKPYTIELIDVDGTNYVGTSTARNFSSDIRVTDYSQLNANGEPSVFEHHVWMNNPLRYAGETFYQSGYSQANAKEYSTLQVVTNSGWMIPYVACMIVAVGMCFQFSVTLLRFADRRAREIKMVEQPVVDGPAHWMPVVAVAFLALWVFSKTKTPKTPDKQFDYAAVGHLPVVADGRVKPLDTYARNLLRIISGTETFKLEYQEDGKTKTRTEPAIRWLMDTIARPDEAKHHKVIRIENLEVLKALNLEPRKGYRYSKAEIEEQPDEKDKMPRDRRLVKLGQKIDEARKKGQRNLSVEDRKAIEFERKFGLYETLSHLGEQPNIEARAPMERMQRAVGFEAALRETKLARVVPPVDNKSDYWDFLTLAELMQPLDEQPEHRLMVKFAMTQISEVLADDSLSMEGNAQLTGSRNWLKRRYPDVEKMDVKDMDGLTKGGARKASPAIAAWRTLLTDYEAGNVAGFNGAVAVYRDSLKGQSFEGVGMSRLGFEWFFNSFQPFLLSSMLYFFAGLLALGAMLGWTRTLNRTAFAICLFTIGLHTFAMIARMVISGRPPVTNLYTTAVFIGWGIVALSLVMEKIYKMGIGNIVASGAGFATLLIAHFLSGDGDTFTVLVAVLDTQFWLATHVTTINLGYAMTFLSGILGLLYIAYRKPLPFAFAMSALLAIVCYKVPGPIASMFETLADLSISAETVKWLGILGGMFGIGATAWAYMQSEYRDAAPLTPELEKNLSRMIYGTLCFGIFFSFVGTVLGGLWADDSWGRFWGWDPKENGALIIVLWNAVVLHARWGGMVGGRGMAVLSVFGNICTGWSWFGVNELNVGLHAYGFTEGVLLALGLFAMSQLVIIGLGCLPQASNKSIPQHSA